MTIKTFQWIVNKLPYSEPFLFVDEILNVGEKSSEGIYTFKPDAAFYKGHFKDNPVTPGVLLTECCAQIGLVSLGIYLLGEESKIEDLVLKWSFYCLFFPEKGFVYNQNLFTLDFIS